MKDAKTLAYINLFAVLGAIPYLCELDAEAAENRALVDAYQINRAPTLIVETDGGIEKLTNASEIRAYLKK